MSSALIDLTSKMSELKQRCEDNDFLLEVLPATKECTYKIFGVKQLGLVCLHKGVADDDIDTFMLNFFC